MKDAQPVTRILDASGEVGDGNNDLPRRDECPVFIVEIILSKHVKGEGRVTHQMEICECVDVAPSEAKARELYGRLVEAALKSRGEVLR